MKTLSATSPAIPTSAAEADRLAFGGPVDTAVRQERRGVFDGLEWTYRGGFEHALERVPASAWHEPARQGWQRIKDNARREVWRAQIDGRVYYLKYYGHGDWATRLKQLLRTSACEAEWQGGIYALRAGVPAVAPAGYTTHLTRDEGPCSLLVTEAVEPAYALSDFWRQIEADRDVRRQRRDAAQMAELLGEMIAKAHQSGFEHLDMHAANILVTPVAPGRYRTLFVDLQSARRGVPISDRAVVRNLAQLNQWFRRHASIGDRLRFLRAYLRWRNEYETEFSFGRPMEVPFRRLVGALAVAAERHAQRLWARRDRRARRNGRYFTRLRLGGGWRGLAAVRVKHTSVESRASQMVFDRAWWSAELKNPQRWFEQSEGQCKNSHSASVRRALLPHADGNLPVIIKRPLARNRRRWISQLLSPSRSMRGWRLGNALLHRNLAAARPLAVLERRRGPFVLDSVLITEAIPGAVDLESYLRTECGRRGSHDRFCLKHSLAPLLARHLRCLEQRGFFHRDCKASNILVLERQQTRLLWIDMDGLQLRFKEPRGRLRLRPLARLYVSLMGIPGVTRTDAVRFLRHYCAGLGADVHAWRALWRQLVPVVQKKIRKGEVRRAWKLANYGRE